MKKKNVTSRKLQAFKQPHLDARIATPESTLTVPKYGIGKFTFFLKIMKNIISRKLQGFEQSYLKARFASPESTLSAPP